MVSLPPQAIVWKAFPLWLEAIEVFVINGMNDQQLSLKVSINERLARWSLQLLLNPLNDRASNAIVPFHVHAVTLELMKDVENTLLTFSDVHTLYSPLLYCLGALSGTTVRNFFQVTHVERCLKCCFVPQPHTAGHESTPK